jgi:hypothetical protein
LLTLVLTATGKKISCIEISDEQFLATFPAPQHVQMAVIQSFHSIAEFGCKFHPQMMRALIVELQLPDRLWWKGCQTESITYHQETSHVGGIYQSNGLGHNTRLIRVLKVKTIISLD